MPMSLTNSFGVSKLKEGSLVASGVISIGSTKTCLVDDMGLSYLTGVALAKPVGKPAFTREGYVNSQTLRKLRGCRERAPLRFATLRNYTLSPRG